MFSLNFCSTMLCWCRAGPTRSRSRAHGCHATGTEEHTGTGPAGAEPAEKWRMVVKCLEVLDREYLRRHVHRRPILHHARPT